jgi:transporter family protein
MFKQSTLEWVLFAVISPAFWALTVVGTKILVDKRFSNPIPFSIFINIFDLIYVAGVFLFLPVGFNVPYSLITMLVGPLNVLAFWLMCKALMVEDVSRISTLNQLAPIGVTFASAIFLGEVLSPSQYLGVFLIVSASMIISYRRIEGRGAVTPAIGFVLASVALSVFYNLVTKQILSNVDPWSYFFWVSVGVFVTKLVLLLSSQVRKDFREMVKLLDYRAYLGVLLTETLFFMGYITLLIAVANGPVSIVSALGSLQPFFVFVFSLFLSFLLPQILREELTRFELFQKAFAVTLIFMGMWLLNVF